MSIDVDIDRHLPSESTRTGYLLRLSRPRFWLYLAGPVGVGVVYAADTVNALFQPLVLVLFAYFLVPANVFLYGVNDVFDAEIDEYNEKKNGREVRYESSQFVIGVTLICGLPVVALAFVLPLSAGVMLAGFLFLAIEYSAPPLRFKTIPFLDSVSNGLYILPGVVAYTVLEGTHPPIAAIAGGWLWTMGMHAFSAIPDIEPDRTAGIETTATVLGEQRTYAYCVVCWFLAAAVFGLVHPFFSVVLIAYPLIVFAIVRMAVDVIDAYWWYPAINTLAGMILTLGGIWTLVFGAKYA